eukprot:TRINITY_DN12630_c0_g3_i3.p2 TRINITY_DN12630_c0_g3~~TRINITY_DN12630_c0_g3_i3.p2  ORF type:complete len:150 (+),score=18.89 TRINITY_DN12630_c0_g3_i3:389-838(+)
MPSCPPVALGKLCQDVRLPTFPLLLAPVQLLRCNLKQPSQVRPCVVVPRVLFAYELLNPSNPTQTCTHHLANLRLAQQQSALVWAVLLEQPPSVRPALGALGMSSQQEVEEFNLLLERNISCAANQARYNTMLCVPKPTSSFLALSADA